MRPGTTDEGFSQDQIDTIRPRPARIYDHHTHEAARGLDLLDPGIGVKR